MVTVIFVEHKCDPFLRVSFGDSSPFFGVCLYVKLGTPIVIFQIAMSRTHSISRVAGQQGVVPLLAIFSCVCAETIQSNLYIMNHV